MSSKIEVYFCSSCAVETNHVLVLVRKTSRFKHSKNRKSKEFITGLINGWAVGSFLASMDEFSRHLICENCGTKIVED